jgi:hypothetical protein
VAFVQARPSPWRQAVDLANMMLCLALRTNPALVYQRALRRFSVAEISEAFAAARGLALPSQLRRMLRQDGRGLHAEFLDLLPSRPQPVRIQRWSARRIALLALMMPVASLVFVSLRTLLVNTDPAVTPLAISSPRCEQLEALWLEAQSVPSASMVPCVASLPEGWTSGATNSRNGWSRFTLDHVRAGKPALIVRLTAVCDTTGTSPQPATQPGTQRYELYDPPRSTMTSYTVFPGGCVTTQLRSIGNGDASLLAQATSAVGYTTRAALQQALEQRSQGRFHLDPLDGE